MNRTDLSNLLNAPTASTDVALSSTARQTPSAPDANGFVYDVSKWSERLFSTHSPDGGSLRGTQQRVQDSMQEQIDDLDLTPDAIETHSTESEGFMRELFSRLHGSPERIESPTGGSWMQIAHDATEGLPEWDRVRDAVSGDPAFAAMAATEMGDAIADMMPKLLAAQDEQDAQDEQEGGQDGSDGDGQGQGEGEGEGEGEDGQGSQTQAQKDASNLPGLRESVRAALRGAARRAAKEADKARSALAGLAPGLGHTPATSEQNDPMRMKLAQRLMSDPLLQEVIKRAGRLTRIAGQSKPELSKVEATEIYGIEQGSDVARMLPSNYITMMDDDLDILFYKDFVEGQLQQYEMISRKPQGRGPMVVLLDESYSMTVGDGAAHMWARAIGLATLATALREKRDVTVIGFDTQVRSAYRITSDGKGQKIDQHGAVIESLPTWGVCGRVVAAESDGGGTDFEQPIRAALNSGIRDERADLIFVTDGLASVPAGIMDELAKAKENGLKVLGVTVGGGSMSESVQAICDTAIDLDREQDAGRSLGRGMA